MFFNNRQNKDLSEKLVKLVVPIAIQQFMLALVSATDAMMLGFVDQASLSAVSLAGQIQFILNLFIAGITAGSGIMISQYWGKQDVKSIEKIMPVALFANLLSGSIFTILALAIPERLIRIFTNEQELITNGTLYIRAVALSYVLCSISQVYLILLKNTGRAAVSSVIGSSAVIVNIICNAVLIFGLLGMPKLGIRGAAYATVISRIVELVWAYIAVNKDRIATVKWSGIIYIDKTLTKDFWHYTTPVLCASLVWGIAFVLYSVILGHMGSDAVAANSIASIVKSMVQCVIRGVSAGAGIIIGNLLGAGNLDKAREYGGKITRLSIVIGIITGMILIILSPLMSGIAPMSDTAGEYLRFMMIVLGFNLMGQSVNTTVLDGIFCAGGDAKFDMKGNIGAMWCFAVPLGFIAAFVFNAPVWLVYIIISLDELVKLPAVYIHYKKFVWVRNITR